MTKTSAKYIIEKEESDYEFKRAGFEWADWNKWIYAKSEGSPVFNVSPGTIGVETGLVASFLDVKILFPYGTTPDVIKERLDKETLAIETIQDAPLYEPVGEWVPF